MIRIRQDGRVAYCIRLENESALKSTVGSNPSPAATLTLLIETGEEP
jgi:hypothetical protein